MIWSDSSRAEGRFGTVRKGAGHVEAVERVRDWTRSRYQLAQNEAILVSEIASAIPGCPPLETVVAFWTADGLRHHFKVFKPVEDVADEDLPPAWMKGALALAEGVECACC